nr:hypothetical protein [Streptomyces tsukubensis NRRL18488]
MVDGDEVHPGLGGGEMGGQQFGPVGEDGGEGVAVGQPGGAQSVDEPVGGGVEPSGRPGLAVGGDEDGLAS